LGLGDDRALNEVNDKGEIQGVLHCIQDDGVEQARAKAKSGGIFPVALRSV
jgi:hypothetical protein